MTSTPPFLAALAALGLCFAISACAPRQPPGGNLWRVVPHPHTQR